MKLTWLPIYSASSARIPDHSIVNETMLSKSTVEHPGETHQNEREIKLDLDRWIRSFLHFSVVISTFYRINKVLPFDRLNKAAFISSKMARYS